MLGFRRTAYIAVAALLVAGVLFAPTASAGQASADLKVRASAAPDPVATGEPLRLTIRVRNLGPDPARRTRLTIAYSANLELSSYTIYIGFISCTLGDQALECRLRNVPSRDFPQETRRVTIEFTTLEPGEATTAVSVISNTDDPQMANNEAETTTTVT